MAEYPYMSVTYRDGKFFAAYLYLAQPTGERRLKTNRLTAAVLVDVDENGNAVGVEFLSRAGIDAAGLNALLRPFHVRPIDAKELAPLIPA